MALIRQITAGISCALTAIASCLVFTQSAQAGELTHPGLCAFERTVIFGASISAETMLRFNGPSRAFVTAVNRMGNGESSLTSDGMKRIFGRSPGRILALDYAKGTVILDAAARYGLPEGTLQLQSLMASDQELDSAFSRIKSRRPWRQHFYKRRLAQIKSQRSEFSKATAIVGIDAFYWTAGFAGSGTIDCADDKLGIITRLIEHAKAKGIALVLGTVPHEDPQRIPYLKSWIGRKIVPSTPQPACADRINALLEKQCRPEAGCYLIYFDARVENLLRGGIEILDGKAYDYAGVRPDGVHLSPAGSQIVVNAILEQMAEYPPPCARAK